MVGILGYIAIIPISASGSFLGGGNDIIINSKSDSVIDVILTSDGL